MIYFTSDTHLGHANIIKYCNRPFRSVEEMDETIINNWNNTVERDDIVFHLGDFCLGGEQEAKKYFSKLNGKVYILKNVNHHDSSWLTDDCLEGKGSFWTKLFTVVLLDPIFNIILKNKEYMYNGHMRRLVLCHFPIYYWELKHYLSWHLYGHIHNREFIILDSPLSMNVGVDLWDFKPLSLKYIAQTFLERQTALNLKAINEEA